MTTQPEQATQEGRITSQLQALDPFVNRQTEDFLHQDTQFVERFYTLLTTSVKPPFAISVDGLWGSGKTTVMNMLQNRLDANWKISPDTLIALKNAGADATVLTRLQPLKTRLCYEKEDEFLQVLTDILGEPELNRYQDQLLEYAKVGSPYPTFWFNPWEYQDAENIVLAFLQHLAKEAYGRFGSVALQGLKVLAVIGLLGINATLSKVNLSLGDIKDTKELLEKEGGWNTAYENYDDLITTIKEEFHKLIQWISKAHNNKPVIIFFDDLDRCLPDTTIQLLEAVKNLFVIPDTNVIFVCGIDTHIAKQFIHEHYKEIGEDFAINYFRKIFNLTISMPSGSGVYTLLQEHIRTLMGWAEAETKALANMITTRGRQADMSSVRKYLNVVNTLYAFQQFNPETYAFQTDNDLIVHLLIVKEAWQPLYEELVQEAMKHRLTTMDELVQKIIEIYQGRKDPLRPEQLSYLQEYLVKPFADSILADELLKYPTLA
ncbi:MAG: hypothetical protein GY801_47805 [bacterium]|nr:hypothetical protein [bacterium]